MPFELAAIVGAPHARDPDTYSGPDSGRSGGSICAWRRCRAVITRWLAPPRPADGGRASRAISRSWEGQGPKRAALSGFPVAPGATYAAEPPGLLWATRRRFDPSPSLSATAHL